VVVLVIPYVITVIILSAVGYLNPARRGSLLNAILTIYALCGFVSGYVSSRLYKAFNGSHHQRCTVFTALLFPGIAFVFFLFFNIILFFLDSTGSVPFRVWNVMRVGCIWSYILYPLVFWGAYVGNKKDRIEFPSIPSCSTMSVRDIPPPKYPWRHPVVSILVGGILPFAGLYVELFFTMTNLWMNQYYYVFGFTLIVYLILIITCAEVTVLLVYYQLCAENHRWWCFAFFAPGSTALYTFIYSVFWFKSLHASRMVTYLLYFGYMGLICSAMLLVTGTIGALTSLWFISKIYGPSYSKTV